ncbi:DUF5993 family protein [Aestuariivirga sp.]|jgi:hypothetical protein|uniref:DUF5993 family protein n=1 Tax=Aestuariivirga sp. TaxID=2650926 RepID=UPI0037836545
MDIIILFLILLIACLMLAGSPRMVILSLWLVAAFLTLGLFHHHATSSLNLSF